MVRLAALEHIVALARVVESAIVVAHTTEVEIRMLSGAVADVVGDLQQLIEIRPESTTQQPVPKPK